MTAKEKCNELVQKFAPHCDGMNMFESFEQGIADKNAKACALICVEEIIAANPHYFYPGRKVVRVSDHSTIEYWQSVRQEIINL